MKLGRNRRGPTRNRYAAATHIHCGHNGRCCECGWWTIPPYDPRRRANPNGADDPPPKHEGRKR